MLDPARPAQPKMPHLESGRKRPPHSLRVLRGPIAGAAGNGKLAVMALRAAKTVATAWHVVNMEHGETSSIAFFTFPPPWSAEGAHNPSPARGARQQGMRANSSSKVPLDLDAAQLSGTLLVRRDFEHPLDSFPLHPSSRPGSSPSRPSHTCGMASFRLCATSNARLLTGASPKCLLPAAARDRPSYPHHRQTPSALPTQQDRRLFVFSYACGASVRGRPFLAVTKIPIPARCLRLQLRLRRPVAPQSFHLSNFPSACGERDFLIVADVFSSVWTSFLDKNLSNFLPPAAH
ncbi:hypothetical protein AURDEDRAFT_166657 [Auricularia subglabra TFB-10046 SS5]|nr:hypothetical protein AURDEDRAFT_166657 [Auricularia subglabra TFB-10046 SS5]